MQHGREAQKVFEDECFLPLDEWSVFTVYFSGRNLRSDQSDLSTIGRSCERWPLFSFVVYILYSFFSDFLSIEKRNKKPKLAACTWVVENAGCLRCWWYWWSCCFFSCVLFSFKISTCAVRRHSKVENGSSDNDEEGVSRCELWSHWERRCRPFVALDGVLRSVVFSRNRKAYMRSCVQGLSMHLVNTRCCSPSAR